MLVSDLKFNKTFIISMTPLILNGTHPDVVRNKAWLIRSVFIMLVMAICSYFLVHGIFFTNLPNGDYDSATSNTIMFFVALNNTTKFWFLLYNRKFARDLIHFVDKDYELARNYNSEEKKIVIDHAKEGIRIGKICLLHFFCGTLFLLKALILMGYYYWKGSPRLVHMYDLPVPGTTFNEFKDTKMGYFVVLLMCSLFGTYTSTMNSGFEAIVPIVMTHICGELVILGKRMENLYVNRNYPEEIRREIKYVNIKLQELYSIIEDIKTRFAPLYELAMKVCVFGVSLTAYQISQDIRHNTLKFEFVVFFLSAMMSFFVPCQYSDRVLEQSERFREAIYDSGWQNHADIPTRKSILIMLIRTRTPMTLKCIFYPLNRESFATMCGQSYTIFNLANFYFSLEA